MEAFGARKRSGPALLDAHALRKMNNADGILSAEGAVPDFVLPAEVVAHGSHFAAGLQKNPKGRIGARARHV